jgi:hypothetical protein
VEHQFGIHHVLDLAFMLRPDYLQKVSIDDTIHSSDLSSWFRVAMRAVQTVNTSQAFVDAVQAGNHDDLARNHVRELMDHIARINTICITVRNSDGRLHSSIPDRPFDKHFLIETMPAGWAVTQVLDAKHHMSPTPNVPHDYLDSANANSGSLNADALNADGGSDFEFDSDGSELDILEAGNIRFESPDLDTPVTNIPKALTGSAWCGKIIITPTFTWQTCETDILPILARLDVSSGKTRKVLNPDILETQMGRGRNIRLGHFQQNADGSWTAMPVNHEL